MKTVSSTIQAAEVALAKIKDIAKAGSHNPILSGDPDELFIRIFKVYSKVLQNAEEEINSPEKVLAPGSTIMQGLSKQ